MSGEHTKSAVAAVLAAVAGGWAGSARSGDLYEAMAERLDRVRLLQSPETAAELERLRGQVRAPIPYVLGESRLPDDLAEQLVALLAEALRQGVPFAALTGGLSSEGEMEAALTRAAVRYHHPVPGLFPSAAEEVHRLRARVEELEVSLADRRGAAGSPGACGRALATGRPCAEHSQRGPEAGRTGRWVITADEETSICRAADRVTPASELEDGGGAS